MGENIYYLELIFILVNIFQQQKLMKKVIQTDLTFEEKIQKALEKKLGCKFIRINTSIAKNGYDLDNEVGNVEAFIDEFKNKKIKKIRREIKKGKRKRQRTKRKIRKINKRKTRKRNKIKIRKRS